MTDREYFEKNLELSNEFSKHLLSHPEWEAQIPEGSQVVLLDDSDPELSRRNRELAREQQEQGHPVVFVHVKGLLPETSRLIDPRLEKAA